MDHKGNKIARDEADRGCVKVIRYIKTLFIYLDLYTCFAINFTSFQSTLFYNF